MKLLIEAAVRSRKHLSLLVITFVTLIALTVASQLEMFALGILSHNGADFFALFSPEKKVELTSPLDQKSAVEVISLEQVEKQWPLIDKEGLAPSASSRLPPIWLKKRDENPLNWLIRKVKDKFGVHLEHQCPDLCPRLRGDI